MVNKERLIWLKNEIVPVSKANINVLSPTSQFGANVFEGIKCYWNEEKKQLFAFKLEEHFDRLLKSIKLIEFDNNYSKEDLKKYFFEIIKANNFKEDIAVRQTVFLDGIGSWNSKEKVEMFIAPITKKRSGIKKGISCCISSWERINENSMSPKIKLGANYMNSRMGQLEALRNGYDSAIFLNNQGKVSEGPGSCLFFIKNGKLITPSITSSILESITREVIIEIAKNEFNIKVEERDVDRTELYNCDEAFLCGTSAEITPINSVDKFEIGNGNIGEISSKLRELYFEIVSGKNEKYKKWLTPIY